MATRILLFIAVCITALLVLGATIGGTISAGKSPHHWKAPDSQVAAKSPHHW